MIIATGPADVYNPQIVGDVQFGPFDEIPDIDRGENENSGIDIEKILEDIETITRYFESIAADNLSSTDMDVLVAIFAGLTGTNQELSMLKQYEEKILSAVESKTGLLKADTEDEDPELAPIEIQLLYAIFRPTTTDVISYGEDNKEDPWYPIFGNSSPYFHFDVDYSLVLYEEYESIAVLRLMNILLARWAEEDFETYEQFRGIKDLHKDINNALKSYRGSGAEGFSDFNPFQLAYLPGEGNNYEDSEIDEELMTKAANIEAIRLIALYLDLMYANENADSIRDHLGFDEAIAIKVAMQELLSLIANGPIPMTIADVLRLLALREALETLKRLKY